MRILKLTEDTKKNLLEDLLKRSPNSYKQYEDSVNDIINKVRSDRDSAVFSYIRQFDGAEVNGANVRVSQAEIDKAYHMVCLVDLRLAYSDICAIHFCSIKLPDIRKNRAVSVAAHLINDVIDTVFILFITVWTAF